MMQQPGIVHADAGKVPVPSVHVVEVDAVLPVLLLHRTSDGRRSDLAHLPEMEQLAKNSVRSFGDRSSYRPTYP